MRCPWQRRDRVPVVAAPVVSTALSGATLRRGDDVLRALSSVEEKVAELRALIEEKSSGT